MPNDRSFYGGEPLAGGAGGEISTGKYRGHEAEQADAAPWKCPACGVQNESPLKFGCVHCGGGKPGYHIGQAPPAAAVEEILAQEQEGKAVTPGAPVSALDAFDTWLRGHQHDPVFRVTENAEILKRAFVAGWLAAQGITVHAAPVTVDVESLAPHTKAQRTIIAALEIFKDQILSQSPDEIESGEWMGPGEVDDLLATLRAQL
jgi:hypothetical protein